MFTHIVRHYASGVKSDRIRADHLIRTEANSFVLKDLMEILCSQKYSIHEKMAAALAIGYHKKSNNAELEVLFKSLQMAKGEPNTYAYRILSGIRHLLSRGLQFHDMSKYYGLIDHYRSAGGKDTKTVANAIYELMHTSEKKSDSVSFISTVEGENFEELVYEGRNLLNENNQSSAHNAFHTWVEKVSKWLNEILPKSGLSAEWSSLGTSKLVVGGRHYSEDIIWREFHDMIQARLAWLAKLEKSYKKSYFNTNTLDDPIQRLCNRFHLILKKLGSRYNQRPTIDIKDEYDVQYFMHALLTLYFDDIRTEEWTPSYAGGSARMDFFIKENEIVIEVKKTHKGFGAKEVSDQLLIDIERYQSHQGCKKLICFV